MTTATELPAVAAAAPAVDVLEEDGLRKAVLGYTWPGIEFGEAPTCAYTFFEYIDAIRLDDLPRFRQLEKECEEWYFPTLDRGGGAALHFAADHGRLEAARYLIEKRGVEVNQRDNVSGWTPLMRCARMAHYKHAPFLKLFEYLLQQGADPSLRAFPWGPALPVVIDGEVSELREAGVIDVSVEKGYGWEVGAVRAELQRLMDKYAGVTKRPAYVYKGPQIGPMALKVQQAWEVLPKLYPPLDWRAPPPAGFVDAHGMRKHSVEPWRPAGDNDGSCRLRPMTEAELAEQAENC